MTQDSSVTEARTIAEIPCTQFVTGFKLVLMLSQPTTYSMFSFPPEDKTAEALS